MVGASKAVQSHFREKDANVAAIYTAILAVARRFGPFREDPKKTSIHLVRKTAFAGVATQKSALILTLKSDRDVRNKRLRKREQVSANRWHLEIKLETPDQVDGELFGWLGRAYSLAG